MQRRCSVFSCANMRETGKNISMYGFPSDPTTCEKWVEFCKSDKLTEILVLQGVDKLRFYYVCSDHFEKPCFVNPKNTSQGIHKGSAPTIIAGHPVLISSFKKLNQIPEYVDLASKKPTPKPPRTNLTVAAKPTQATVPASQHAPTEVKLNFHPEMLACPCKRKSEYESMFYAERSRAVDLVRQINEQRRQLASIKKSQVRRDALKRVNNSILKIKNKIRNLAMAHQVTIDLDSNDEDGHAHFEL